MQRKTQESVKNISAMTECLTESNSIFVCMCVQMCMHGIDSWTGEESRFCQIV